MGQYTYQAIIGVYNGADDDAVKRAVLHLYRKAKASKLDCNFTHLFKESNDAAAATMQLSKVIGRKWDEGTRVYIVGHGAWQSQTLGGHKPFTLARVLQRAGLPLTETGAGVISVVACSAGKTLSMAPAQQVLGAHSSSCFAQRLHQILKSNVRDPIKTRVRARTLNVSVDKGGQKWVTVLPEMVPRELSDNVAAAKTATDVKGGIWSQKIPYSKVEYYWQGNLQMRKWVYEDEEDTAGAAKLPELPPGVDP